MRPSVILAMAAVAALTWVAAVVRLPSRRQRACGSSRMQRATSEAGGLPDALIAEREAALVTAVFLT